MKNIIYRSLIFIVFGIISGCSIFTLDHTNPNDPVSSGDEANLFPNYNKIEVDSKVRGSLSSLNIYTKTYYFKFSAGETYTLIFDRLGYENSFYGYFSLYILDQNENEIQQYNKLYMDKDFTISTYLIPGEFILLKFELDDLNMMDYTIEVSAE